MTTKLFEWFKLNSKRYSFSKPLKPQNLNALNLGLI